MKQKQSERITNAIIEVLFGPQPWISGVHPLNKIKCKFCYEFVCFKNMERHVADLHPIAGLDPAFPDEEIAQKPLPSEEEIDGMFRSLNPEAHDEENRPQSEGGAYRTKF